MFPTTSSSSVVSCWFSNSLIDTMIHSLTGQVATESKTYSNYNVVSLVESWTASLYCWVTTVSGQYLKLLFASRDVDFRAGEILRVTFEPNKSGLTGDYSKLKLD